MTKRLNHRTSICLVFAVLFGAQVFAQMTITGSLSGAVTDPSGQVVPGAKVTLTNAKTGDVRTAISNETGSFSFVALPPDTYSIKIEHEGFKSIQHSGVVVTANAHVAVGDIQLQIGAVSETVSVEAQGATVQTESTEHSAELSTVQLTNLTARGREVTSLLRTIPGVQYQADQDSVGGNFGTTSPSIGGTNAALNIIAVDGVVSNDMGSPNTFSSVTTLDAIGEVKVILNSYQAEYAGNGGAVIQVVSKSGGKEFHGNGYWFLRNEDFNANDFFSNRNSVVRPKYRFNTEGASLGGPIYIPGKFNQSKTLLFGYYNIENIQIKIPTAVTQYTMPSALERAGDFTQSLDTSGRLIYIKDPLLTAACSVTAGGAGCFPNNVIPAARLNTSGQVLLGTLPLPNFVNRAITGGNYNYQIQDVTNQPKRSQLFKIDIVPSDKDRFYVRGKTWLSTQYAFNGTAGAKPVGFFAQCYCFTESGLSTGWTHVFSPSIVMEVTAGIRHNHEAWHPYPDDSALKNVTRSGIGFKAGQWYPQANSQDIIPRFTFGVTNSPDVTFDDRFLTGGTDFNFSFNDNVTVTRGAHTMKAGLSILRIREYEGERSVFSGRFVFSRDTNNPLDSNYAFSNATLGNFSSYTESNARFGANERQSIIEWFLQDTWKVTRKLTLDYGLRFSWYNQMYPNNAGQQSVLALDKYSLSQAPVFYQPTLSGTTRMAKNPLTGQLLPAVFIGGFVPGTGNPADGGVTSGDNSYPRGFVDQQPVLYGPRLGFAYDPFGKGKTAIRGGASILYNMRVSKWSATTNNPPAIFTPITYYGNMSTFLQGAGVLFPGDTNSYNRKEKTPGVYNLTFGIQQDLGFSTLLDVSYLGVLGQHLIQTQALNTLPYGARFLAQNQDSTFTPARALPDNFFRPYPGYNNITYSDNAYTSNYHALLVSLNRRFSKSLQLGVAYTYSKFMDYTGIPVYRPLRTWSYGLDSTDQTHNFVVNYTYRLPRLSALLPNAVVRHAFDNWQISGITQFVSGAPSGVSFSTTAGTDLTGGGDGQRVNVVGDAKADGKDFYHWFNNTTAFALPGRGDPGNAGKVTIRLPGVANWDMALSKTFPTGGEKRNLQFRWEAYNVFNHTQYSGLNTAARFDSTTGAQTNTLFGQVTSTRTARVMQGSLRFTF